MKVTFGCCSVYAFCAASSHASDPGASVSPHHQTSIVTGSVGRSWASAGEEASRRGVEETPKVSANEHDHQT